MKQTVKIIGGKFKGKNITFPDHIGLRPTPSRVRETLFNWLMYDIRGARCLDAFAGSGALGFEAYSRGAQEVWWVEHSLTVFQHLQKFALSFNDAQLHVVHQHACAFLSTNPKPFDIIFLDPPFDGHYLSECIKLIEQHNTLQSQGLLYIESPSPPIVCKTQWHLLKSKQTGMVFYGLYQKTSS